jgi:hypothetical protein
MYVCAGKAAQKSKTPRTTLNCRSVVFYESEYTTFKAFVKSNLKNILFFLELVSFQEHSGAIPRSFSPQIDPAKAGVA